MMFLFLMTIDGIETIRTLPGPCPAAVATPLGLRLCRALFIFPMYSTKKTILIGAAKSTNPVQTPSSQEATA
jgi:hypothetical protein